MYNNPQNVVIIPTIITPIIFNLNDTALQYSFEFGSKAAISEKIIKWEIASQKKRFNILCFGDSLTSGYYIGEYYINSESGYPTKIYHSPYASTLQEIIHEKMTTNMHVYHDGKDGDLAAHMPARLTKCLNSRTYHLVIIIAGTNDLCYPQYTQDNISSNIIQLHKICHHRNIPTVISSIPEAKLQDNAFIERRNAVNKNIFNYYAKNTSNMIQFDYNKLIPYHSMTKNDQQLYWNDGLHLTPKGYQYLANNIYNSIKDFLNTKLEH